MAPTSAYSQGCYVARLIPLSAANQRAALGDSAMNLLRRSVAAGYSDYDFMKKDSDLNPLRNRADFKALMADVESKRTPPEP